MIYQVRCYCGDSIDGVILCLGRLSLNN